jgi:hypothetical protein
LLGKVRKIKNYDKYGNLIKHVNLKKFENMEEKREIAAQVIERFVHSHIIKMKAKKEIQMRTDLNRNNKMNHERY